MRGTDTNPEPNVPTTYYIEGEVVGGKVFAAFTSLRAQLSEQQTNHMALVAQLERERDTFYLDYRMKCDVETKSFLEQLATMTKERDKYQHYFYAADKQATVTKNELDDCIYLRNIDTNNLISVMDQLAAITKELDTFKAAYLEGVNGHNLTLDELAACQALCQQYREAIEKIHAVAAPYDDGVKFGYIKDLAVEAIANPSPTAALNNAIAEELERMCRVAKKATWQSELLARAKELREMK